MATKPKARMAIMAADPADTIAGAVALTGQHIYVGMPNVPRLLVVGVPDLDSAVRVEYKVGNSWILVKEFMGNDAGMIQMGSGPCRIRAEGAAVFALM